MNQNNNIEHIRSNYTTHTGPTQSLTKVKYFIIFIYPLSFM